jgi:hypothetical protein
MLTQVLALPKLNLQYLTFHDYLLRNFNLFRLESTYEIRQDVEDVALRLRYSIYSIYLLYWYKSTNTDAPRRAFSPRLDNSRTIFQGWSRYSRYLLYWYKDTHTDTSRNQILAAALRLRCGGGGQAAPGGDPPRARAW